MNVIRKNWFSASFVEIRVRFNVVQQPIFSLSPVLGGEGDQLWG
jgi:hypothetical protein